MELSGIGWRLNGQDVFLRGGDVMSMHRSLRVVLHTVVYALIGSQGGYAADNGSSAPAHVISRIFSVVPEAGRGRQGLVMARKRKEAMLCTHQRA